VLLGSTRLHSTALSCTELHSLCAKGCKQDASHLNESGRHAGGVKQQPCAAAVVSSWQQQWRH
jgi:hypothetical protein